MTEIIFYILATRHLIRKLIALQLCSVAETVW